ncbi:aldolase [Pseudaminobacter sp. 19-2017]|uniref:Aldolase n=1 Tax=Pseudaminobacter soli (ex Zhang et al. 2022) TaxID=2831468 RepID=A0A942E227_9HYPH|nr:PqqD family protein [Pseudaminobacter soli]MBS3651688.1 aldolase [Pseudaminobacter soli]
MKPQRLTDLTGASCSAEDAPLVTQGRLVRIRGQNILFSASRRAIFALSDTSADIWHALEDGLPLEAIAVRIANDSVDAHEARGQVEVALSDWERLDLIRPRAPSQIPSHGHVSQLVAVRGLCVRIVYPAALAFPTMTIFRHLEVRRERIADIRIEVVEGGDRVHLFRNGDWIHSCSPDELATVLKGQLLTDALEHGAYELALHAAALIKNDRMLLLCGSPGAGKTTLTLALAHAGFGFAADDVTVLDSMGHGLGLPFAPAVKAGAWPLLAEYCPDLGAAPVFRRPDRKRVRYVVPSGLSAATSSPTPVGWIVLLRRDHDSPACLEPIDSVGALHGLLNGAFAPGRELGGSGFEALAQVIGSAEAYCLTYSGLDDAVRLIRKTCR